MSGKKRRTALVIATEIDELLAATIKQGVPANDMLVISRRISEYGRQCEQEGALAEARRAAAVATATM